MVVVILAIAAADKATVQYIQIWNMDVAGPALTTLLESTDEKTGKKMRELLSESITRNTQDVGGVNVKALIENKIKNRECKLYNCEFCVGDINNCDWKILIKKDPLIEVDKTFTMQTQSAYIPTPDLNRKSQVHLTLW